jgi:O-antigen/teichoic acid export membrane protein
MARGAAWMVAFRLFDRSIGIVSTAVLARLLVPADFGLVAMAMSVIAVIELATAFSFEVALIQKADPQREHYDTAWTLNILMALGGSLVTAALAFAAAGWYGDARLVPVMLCIAAGWMCSGFENPGTANFRRRMDFSTEFRFMASKRVITFAVTMVAAITFRSYWALVIGMVTGRLVGVALSYAMEPYRPRLSLACTRELMSFSGWLLANNLVGVALTRLPHFVVGRLYGAQALGAYTVGSEIAQLAHTELVAPINRAMFPGYARLVGDPPAFRKVCVEATGAILLVVLPVSVAVAVLAPAIVRILLGEQWSAAVPLIQILAFAGAVTAVTSNNGAAYIALGRPRLLTAILAVRLAVFVVVVLLFASGRDLAAVAYAELAAALASLVVSLPLLLRVVRIPAVDYLACLWKPALASAAAAAAVHFLLGPTTPSPPIGAAGVQLAVGLPIGTAVYVGLLWVLWRLAGRPETVEAALGRRVRAALRDRWAGLRRAGSG